MARIKLIPQKREFFEIYNRAAANIVEIADKLIELLDRFPDGANDLYRDVRELEHEGDRLTHDLVNRTFVTPFDRDDMYRLAAPFRRAWRFSSRRLPTSPARSSRPRSRRPSRRGSTPIWRRSRRSSRRSSARSCGIS